MYLPSHPLYVFVYVKCFCFAVVVVVVVDVVVGTWRLYFLFVFNCKYLFVHFPLRYLPTSDVNADKDEATFSKGFRFVFIFTCQALSRCSHTHTHTHRGVGKLLTQTCSRM